MSGETIFITEDEHLIVLHLVELLETNGYRISGPAYSGEMMLHMLKTLPEPDLILVDIGLPGAIDGIEAVRRVRRQSEVPVVFLSACPPDSVLEGIQEMAPAEFLSKPVMDTELLATIRNVLSIQADRS